MPAVITECAGRFRGIDEWHLISLGRRKKFIRGCDKKIRKKKEKLTQRKRILKLCYVKNQRIYKGNMSDQAIGRIHWSFYGMLNFVFLLDILLKNETVIKLIKSPSRSFFFFSKIVVWGKWLILLLPLIKKYSTIKFSSSLRIVNALLNNHCPKISLLVIL